MVRPQSPDQVGPREMNPWRTPTRLLRPPSRNRRHSPLPSVLLWTAERLRVRRYLWPALCFCQLGLIVGWAITPKSETSSRPAQSDEEASLGGRFQPLEKFNPAPAELDAAPTDPSNLGRADHAFRSGRDEVAPAIYRQGNAATSLTPREVFRYRSALCLEALGKGEEALALYRETASQQQNAYAVAAGQLGQARIDFSRRQFIEAKGLLGQMIARSAEPTLRDQPNQIFLAEARYRLALV